MAPERVEASLSKGDSTMAKSDVWSIGVLISMLVFGRPPFDGNNNATLYKSIKKGGLSV